MTRYIHPEVQAYVDDRVDSRVRLAVVPADGASHAIQESFDEFDASLERTLPSGVMIVAIHTSDLPSLFAVDGIESISPTSGMEILV